MMQPYNPRDWYWIVAGDATRAWSSADGAYVNEYPSDRLTRIASEAELADVVRPYGLALPVYVLGDYQVAIQTHIDAVAKSRGYDGGISLAGYLNSTVRAWAGEAQAFISWRDSVWVYVYEQLAAVEGQQRAQPTPAALISELPTIAWPA